MTSRPYQICTRCVMDTSDPLISFDADGLCNHCREAEMLLPSCHVDNATAQRRIDEWAARIKADAKGPYDSIIGLSGGVDSSYVAYLAREMGLRPLAVHFDNGWNSEIAVSNIKKIVDACGFDLYTYVIDWPEFRDLQRSFFLADVVDVELLTDHAIFAALYRLRRQHNIKYILSGTNYATEHGMPKSWNWRKTDLTNIKSIQKEFGTIKIKSFPTITTLKWLSSRYLGLGGTFVELLNCIDYRKDKAIDVLRREFGWREYGGKHYESIFTKFYQAYYLPQKFNIDKRRPHVSALVRNGEIDRDTALAELEAPLYSDNELAVDRSYVLKKLGFTEDEWARIMSREPKSHLAYGSDQWLQNWIARLKPLKERLIAARGSLSTSVDHRRPLA